MHTLLCCFLRWVFGGCLYSCCLNASGLCQVILPGHVHLAWVASTDCKKRFWSLLCCSYKTSMFSEATVPNIMCIASFVLVFTLVKGANWLFLSSVQFWHFLWKKCCTIAPIFKAFHGSNSGKHFILGSWIQVPVQSWNLKLVWINLQCFSKVLVPLLVFS